MGFMVSTKTCAELL